MPGPKRQSEIAKIASEILHSGRYVDARHFGERMRERKVNAADIFAAIEHPTKVVPYSGAPEHDGTSWRIWGRDADGTRKIGIGVEICQTGGSMQMVLVSVMLETPPPARRKK